MESPTTWKRSNENMYGRLMEDLFWLRMSNLRREREQWSAGRDKQKIHIFIFPRTATNVPSGIIFS
jgi:hypothetical protein